MTLSYAKLYPMGNSTVLIDSLKNEVTPDMFKTVAALVMQEKYIPCEQVGFVCPPRRPDHVSRLEMMGGELCVNALRTLGYLHHRRTGQRTFLVESSGSDRSFSLAVTPDDLVSLNFDMDFQHISLSENLSLINLQGISHFVERFSDVDAITREYIVERHEFFRKQYIQYIQHPNAIGYIPYDQKDTIRIVPYIYIEDTNTRIFETACGSGSIAVAVREHTLFKKTEVSFIRQPSSEIFQLYVFELAPGSFHVDITSDVNLVSQGQIFLSEKELGLSVDNKSYLKESIASSMLENVSCLRS